MEYLYKNNDIVEVADNYGIGKKFNAKIKGIAGSGVPVLGCTYIIEPLEKIIETAGSYDYDCLVVFETHLTLIEKMDTQTEAVVNQLKNLTAPEIRIRSDVSDENVKDSLLEHCKREYTTMLSLTDQEK